MYEFEDVLVNHVVCGGGHLANYSVLVFIDIQKNLYMWLTQGTHNHVSILVAELNHRNGILYHYLDYR